MGKIIKISGPLVVAESVENIHLFDVVKVGDANLMGEVIELRENKSWIQVYEDTSGISVGESVESTGKPLTLKLGPGVLNNIFDGILRPLKAVSEISGIYINKGIDVSSLDTEKKWTFNALLKKGHAVVAGDILGEVAETSSIKCKIMVPFGVEGEIESIESGEYRVDEVVANIMQTNGEIVDVTLVQEWPIRKARPVKKRLMPNEPLITGTRVLDTFFPLAKGGVAAIPGPFGSGKSVTQQSIAKWCNAQVIVYIGCGERGNEMTDVLKEFPELVDGNTGNPLMERTVLIANTSNMPIAAREASVYTGITIAEFYRDMGYDVALMADSTSRWAEAMKEMSGRLEEMPSEGGYPAYLNTRITQFYERAGYAETLGSDDGRVGSISVIGAVSPPGGDLSEPVSQNTLSVAKVFWSLDSSLAYARHYPAIHWLRSYSNYTDSVAHPYFIKNIGEAYVENINLGLKLLKKEAELQEIIRIVGSDSLSNADRLLLRVAQSIREDFLQQNAFDEVDAYASLTKQSSMLEVIMFYYREAMELLEADIDFESLLNIQVLEKVARMKSLNEKEMAENKERYLGDIKNELKALMTADN